MIMGGVTEKASLLLNSSEPLPTDQTLTFKKIFAVDATAIAESLNLKTTSFSIVNTAMVGGLAGASRLIELPEIVRAIRDLAPIKKEENIAAAEKAYALVKEISR
jgi:Pyruvate/2-oxoacid:ferredoxin oxidoreductase gamma subunit